MTAPRELAFGFSPCPNDTFAFWAAVHGVAGDGALRLVPQLADIETLNQRAVVGTAPLPITKLSLPALAHVTRDYTVLPAGAALGFGCGPLVLQRTADTGRSLPALAGQRIAIPGRHTTAFLLFALFGPRDCEFVPMSFDRIMPAVARGDCAAGLVIHESRFTYPAHGLVMVADLGELWERDTGTPLPLGVIAARRELGVTAFTAVGDLLRASVRCARAAPERPRAYVRAHAQELADDVCDRHIALYVNAFTEDLGSQGRAAIDLLLQRGRAVGLLPAGPAPWWGAV